MTDTELSGVCPIVDTPFTDDGDVDYDSLENLCATLIENGCDALALFGFASEFYKLTDAEREEMAERMIDVCDGRDVPSIVSTSAYRSAKKDGDIVIPVDPGAYWTITGRSTASPTATRWS